ncbi:MAG: transposase domain-containing protein [Saprospiraceae bacterium]|nr:transposase domain-containing protein [Saprospiraceae bacterium]
MSKSSVPSNYIKYVFGRMDTFATCKLHDINPYDWLTDVFHRIKDHPINRISELLPQNWYRSTAKKNIESVA